MPDDHDELMKIIESGLPDHSDEYIPDLVHDFLLDYWGDLKKILDVD